MSRIKKNYFSETLIAAYYFVKNGSYSRQSKAIPYIKDRFILHELLSRQSIRQNEKILYMEFGVRWGQIINNWASYNNNKGSLFWGFDTFIGIPEAWGNVKAGSYSMDGEIPVTDDKRVVFHAGMVQDTLPHLLIDFDWSRKLVLHFDFDIYSATLFTMLALQPYYKKGDILIFDEFFSITKNHHEYRAFKDFLSLHKLEYIPLFKKRKGQYVIEVC